MEQLLIERIFKYFFSKKWICQYLSELGGILFSPFRPILISFLRIQTSVITSYQILEYPVAHWFSQFLSSFFPDHVLTLNTQSTSLPLSPILPRSSLYSPISDASSSSPSCPCLIVSFFSFLFLMFLTSQIDRDQMAKCCFWVEKRPKVCADE